MPLDSALTELTLTETLSFSTLRTSSIAAEWTTVFWEPGGCPRVCVPPCVHTVGQQLPAPFRIHTSLGSKRQEDLPEPFLQEHINHKQASSAVLRTGTEWCCAQQEQRDACFMGAAGTPGSPNTTVRTSLLSPVWL